MKSKEIALLSIAVVAVGIFALPSTVSMFGGQHNWYDLSAGPNDVPCEKCHADVAEEMQSGANGAHRNLTCAMCHRTPFNNAYNSSSGHYEPESSKTYASGEGDGSTPGKEAHAASIVECMDCHGVRDEGSTWDWYHTDYPEYNGPQDNCWKCHGTETDWNSRGTYDFISAGGFGFGTTYGLRPPDTGEKAAHKKFVLDAINDSLMAGANEACIACHTNVAIDINWKHAYTMNFTANGVGGTWTVSDFTSEGTYNVTTYGNMTGDITGVSEPIVKWQNGTVVPNP